MTKPRSVRHSLSCARPESPSRWEPESFEDAVRIYCIFLGAPSHTHTQHTHQTPPENSAECTLCCRLKAMFPEPDDDELYLYALYARIHEAYTRVAVRGCRHEKVVDRLYRDLRQAEECCPSRKERVKARRWSKSNGIRASWRPQKTKISSCHILGRLHSLCTALPKPEQAEVWWLSLKRTSFEKSKNGQRPSSSSGILLSLILSPIEFLFRSSSRRPMVS